MFTSLIGERKKINNIHLIPSMDDGEEYMKVKITQLCEQIGLQPEIRAKVLRIASTLDLRFLGDLLKEFYNYEKARSVHLSIQTVLGEDSFNLKILTCMLYVSAITHGIYNERGISDEIFFATMKCYPRFLQETYQRTGRWEFDRFWWTARQAGAHLFRIGELEYEIKRLQDDVIIGIHIPSDADLSPEAVNASLELSKHFFADYYPELSECEYICHSWLMDPQLKKMLASDSNILNFQLKFEIYDIGQESEDYLDWVFQTEGKSYKDLPENTSLQRKLKEFLLLGGKIHDSYGRLN